MAVHPTEQRHGVGSALVVAGLERCKELGYGAVVVLGHRDYYSSDQSAWSLEYVARSIRNSTVDGSYRLVAVAEHKIGDITWLTASFGHDRTRTDSPGSLLAELGVSLNLSKERYKFNQRWPAARAGRHFCSADEHT